MNLSQQKTACKAVKEKTLSTFTQLDDNLWTLVYGADYGLDELLEKGVGNIMDAILFLQKKVHTPIIPNPTHGGFACSTFNARTDDGQYLFGRNFDYKKAPCAVCWTSPEKGYKSISVIDTTFFIHGTDHFTLKSSKKHQRVLGAPYMAMDGINEAGFSIGVLEIKSKATKQQTGKKPIITTVAIRAALDKCATVDEAIELFRQYDMHDSIFINYHYQLADAEGNSAIIEYVNNEMHVIRQQEKNECLALTNYFLTEGGDNHDGRGYDRYCRIKKRLRQSGGVIGEKDAMQLLSDCTLNYKHPQLGHQVITLWSAVYNCTEKSMLLCAGMNYEKKYRFSIDKPGEFTVVE